MPDSKRFLHPEAIRKIGRLGCVPNTSSKVFWRGMHRSPYLGQSVDFVQHREYAHGDDLRHVDWKVWPGKTAWSSSNSKRKPTFAA